MKDFNKPSSDCNSSLPQVGKKCTNAPCRLFNCRMCNKTLAVALAERLCPNCTRLESFKAKIIKMTNPVWRDALKKLVREHMVEDYPIWLDGFADVILHGHSSGKNDNPYVPQETRQYREYREGALAAESLLRSKITEVHHD